MKSINTALFKKNTVVAVALSGGKDSVALCHYLHNNANLLNIKVIALNVEHGIRGESSIGDSKFVKDFCVDRGIDLISYSVDALNYAKNNKISVEEAARILRYNCFSDAITQKKCDVVATAHHKKDHFESVLLNIFRGTGLKGLIGINEDFRGKIIRPMLNVSKDEIDEYIKENNLPFVTDQTNFSTDYTRNALRLNVIPQIEKIFPDAEDAVLRLSAIAKLEDGFLDKLADGYVKECETAYSVDLSVPEEILARAVIIALKKAGLLKDWTRSHVNEVVNLKNLSSGSKISLPKGFVAFKEYDTIVITKSKDKESLSIPFTLGKHRFLDQIVCAEKIGGVLQLNDGLYGDLKKIPASAVIRTKEDGDFFTKFGGGTKSLGDFLTDKKIPARLRASLPVLANGKEVLVIFGVAVSNKLRVDSSTLEIVKFTREK